MVILDDMGVTKLSAKKCFKVKGAFLCMIRKGGWKKLGLPP